MRIADCGSRIVDLRDFRFKIVDCRLKGFRCRVSGVREEKQERHDALYPEPCTPYPDYWLLDSLILDLRLQIVDCRLKAIC